MKKDFEKWNKSKRDDSMGTPVLYRSTHILTETGILGSALPHPHRIISMIKDAWVVRSLLDSRMRIASSQREIFETDFNGLKDKLKALLP